MEDKGEVLYEIGPKFDLIYELTSPTGKKIKSSLVFLIVSIIIKIITMCLKNKIIELSSNITFNLYNTLSIVLWIFVIFSIIMFVARIVIQSMEYNGIKYKFYENCMTVENNFLNQTRKTIEYANVKEIEIRRTLLDRIINYGIIIIYTNAEKSYSSATIIYAVKNIQEHYEKIEHLIHKDNSEMYR